MSETQFNQLETSPYFDMEAFMILSHETRLGGATLERLAGFWEKWRPQLQVREIRTGKISYLAVWLPATVETEVDEAWDRSASDGFLINNLAQFLCMTAVRELLPEVEEGDCAPSPRPTASLRSALDSLGVPYKGEDSSLLSLRYAVVTHYPYRGGCEICHMQAYCPKGQGEAESASVLLPGYEREQEPQG